MNGQSAEQLYTREDCDRDPQFLDPYTDTEEWRSFPIRHYYVHGGFRGTQTKFCFYMPPMETFQHRIFQRMMPVQGDETAAQAQAGTEDDAISFFVSHGAIYIDTNMGGMVNGGGDKTLVYRSSAACCEYARQLVRTHGVEGHVFGYVYGGSGGAFKTIGCLESTEGIWDAGLALVMGSPVSLPNVFTVRVHAMRLLRHKMDAIVDAIEPGGSGDPYAVLNDEEKAALREATLMGFPMQTWTVWKTIGDGALPVLAPLIAAMDPSYFTDFWEKEGYLGSDPAGSAVRDRIRYETVITEITEPAEKLNSIADTIDEKNAYGVDEAWKHLLGKGEKLPLFTLEDFPEGDVYARGLTLTFLDGALAGQKIHAVWLGNRMVTGEPDPMGGRDLKSLLAEVKTGDRVLVDNSDYIATQTYHRHQVPGPEYHAWDQFRDAQGNPIYPQRPFLIGPAIAEGGAGSVQSGKIHGKCIVMESLMDESALPWQADWYRDAVRKNSGMPEEENFRLYYMEHCMHTDCGEGNGGDHQHVVSYAGAANQTFLYLADWTEKGKLPPETSGYQMDGGQVIISAHAAERRGVQPVITLRADGRVRDEIAAGQAVSFDAEIEIPAQCPEVEKVLWDFNDSGVFAENGQMQEPEHPADGTGRVSCRCSHVFDECGTYFVSVKVAANSEPGNALTRIWNLARVRIVVS